MPYRTLRLIGHFSFRVYSGFVVYDGECNYIVENCGEKHFMKDIVADPKKQNGINF